MHNTSFLKDFHTNHLVINVWSALNKIFFSYDPFLTLRIKISNTKDKDKRCKGEN